MRVGEPEVRDVTVRVGKRSSVTHPECITKTMGTFSSFRRRFLAKPLAGLCAMPLLR